MLYRPPTGPKPAVRGIQSPDYLVGILMDGLALILGALRMVFRNGAESSSCVLPDGIRSKSSS